MPCLGEQQLLTTGAVSISVLSLLKSFRFHCLSLFWVIHLVTIPFMKRRKPSAVGRFHVISQNDMQGDFLTKHWGSHIGGSPLFVSSRRTVYSKIAPLSADDTSLAYRAR